MSPAIEAFGTTGFLVALLGLPAYFLAVVGLIRGDGEQSPGSVQHLFDDLAVMDMSTRNAIPYKKGERMALPFGRYD